MNIKIPDNVEKILKQLHKNNYKAYVVGGCVRDSLLKKMPHDWDICTNAHPEEIISCFKEYNVIPTGLKHGTVSVIINHTPYEITTFRTESSYSDHRRPDSIEFVKNLKEDLSRRDFTINAMAYNTEESLFDYFGGQSDLKNKCIRCVGNPEKRFMEDALRILRCIRFSSTYKFSIDHETEKAIFSCAKYLKYISKERIQNELCKFLCGNGCAETLKNYKEIIFLIIPDLKPLDGFNQHNPHHKYDIWNHTIETIHNTPTNDIILRWAALLHDIGKPYCFSMGGNGVGHFYKHVQKSTDIAKAILKKYKMDKKRTFEILQLIENHDIQLIPEKKYARRLLHHIKNNQQVFRLLKLKKADIIAQDNRKEELHKIEIMKNLVEKEIAAQSCFSLRDLQLNGNDLLSYGFPKGKIIGETLNKLLNYVIDGVIPNNKEFLENWIKENYFMVLQTPQEPVDQVLRNND